MNQSYNLRNPSVKRILKEVKELSEPTYEYAASPLENNIYEWHFTFRGPEATDFEGGIYHGRIILPHEYPMKPPNIILLNASGRFQVGKKICLSISGHHPETWQPSWSIRTAILALVGFMETKGEGSLGALDYPPEERRKLAKQSVNFSCPQCGYIRDLLLKDKPRNGAGNPAHDEKDRELAKQIEVGKKPAVSSEKKVEKKEEKPEKVQTTEKDKPESSNQVEEVEKFVSTPKDQKPVVLKEPPKAPTIPEAHPIDPLDDVAIMRRRENTGSDTTIDVIVHVAIAVIISVVAFLVYRRVKMIYDEN